MSAAIEVIQQVLDMATSDLERASDEFNADRHQLERSRKRVAERQDRVDALKAALEAVEKVAQ